MANWSLIGAMALPNVGGWIGAVMVNKDSIKWYEVRVMSE